MIQTDQALRYVEILAAIGVIISSLEILLHPAQMRDEGLMSWPIAQLRHRRLAAGPLHRLLNIAFAHRGILVLQAVRLLAATLLLAGVSNQAFAAILAVLVMATSVASYLRTSFGSDGADQMTVLTFAALALARAVGGTFVPVVCLWFLALQACLSYTSAGVHKALSPWWRSRPAMTGILSTSAYGATWAASHLVHRPQVSVALGWLVILGELSFPAMLILPDPVPWIFLLSGAAFHVATAFVMGLNSFLWAFVATYPALLYCAAM